MVTPGPADGNRVDGGEDIAWVRRVNARWIVHGGLDQSAGAYMDRLRGTDPTRLALSCRIARALAGQADPGEDPKPWFYAGLFSMARPEEVAEFLLGHRLFTTILLTDPPAEGPAQSRPDFGPATLGTIRRIRAAIAQLSREHIRKAAGTPGAGH
ncbi:MAG TPA: hypothetical protein PLU30_13345 [Verrucomicrobiae bacterium]|nr:hypothetical protein [Verrucomicrobiae bacterium]